MKSLVAPPGGLDGGGALVIETETERVFCGASLINIFFDVHCIAQSMPPSVTPHLISSWQSHKNS